MQDAPHSLVTNWLQKAIATVCARVFGSLLLREAKLLVFVVCSVLQTGEGDSSAQGVTEGRRRKGEVYRREETSCKCPTLLC